MGMLDSTLIDVVNVSMEETRKWVESEMNLNRLVACVEIRGITRSEKSRTKCGFSYTTALATGEAESDESFREFLQKQIHSAHFHLLKGENVPMMAWGASPVIIKRVERRDRKNGFDYSIAVGAVGGTRQENNTIVDAIISDIS